MMMNQVSGVHSAALPSYRLNNGSKNRSDSVSSGCPASNNNGQPASNSSSCLSADNSNNSNSKRNSSSKCNSYSKLFRQYLPQSLSLKSYTLGSSHQDSCKEVVFEQAAGAQIEKRKEKKQQQQHLVDISDGCRVVSTLSRLKLTSGHLHCGESKRLCGVEEVSKSQVSRLKRKGFLYLKKRRSSDLIDSDSFRETTIDTDKQRVNNKVVSVYKKRDLNNNSIGNLLNSNQCVNKYDDEHTTCLLEDEQDEDREEYSSTSIKQQPAMFRQNHRGQEAGSGSSKNRNRKTESNTAAGKSSTLLVSGCLLSLVSLIVLLSSARLLVTAQQSSGAGAIQPPFSRSQPASGSPVSAVTGGGGSGRIPPLQPAAGSLVANINCNKIRGHVTLTPNAQVGQGGALTTVSTQISAGPPGEVYQWSVHQFPVKPGAAMCSCSPMILGTKLIDLSEMHGNLPSDQEFSVQSSLNLFGSDSLVGHSLMLRGLKTGMVACATFLPTSGSVTIFQTAFGTSFISHLMYSNGTRRHSAHRFDLVKSEDDIVTTSLSSVGPSQAGNLLPLSAATRAESLALEQREHEHELSQCRRFAQGEPLLRNMSYQLTVSTENFGMRGRTSMVLPQIPFETFGSVFVVIYSELDPLEPLACAPLKFVKPKTAAAKFQSVSVQGSVVFSQDSPYDPTVARINLNLPNSDGHSYGIDELPMIIRRKSDTRVCPNIREIIYNPHHVEPSSVPAEGEATSDQYAVGDLSGKYGSLTGKASEKLTVNDFNLPLYGPISIVGRAMTVYSAEGVAIACSNVELTTPMTTAFATFDFGIQGQFIFRQPVNDCNGDTYVYIEVSKPTGAGNQAPVSGSQPLLSAASNVHHLHSSSGDHNSRSLDHNWHIHANPVDSGLDHLSTTDCHAAGPHYNPFNTSTGSIYSRDCTPFNVLRCELGDLSAKMFTIEIPPYRVKNGMEPDIGKFFGTDIDLPLCGPVSIVNRSVVVHVQDFGQQRLACSTVIEFKSRTS